MKIGDKVFVKGTIDEIRKDVVIIRNRDGYFGTAPSEVVGAEMSLPSEQTEPLTDQEQRIFLKAMEREENVCKEVDDQWRGCREPYENSLVWVCKEIRRKVKEALWRQKND